jgi:ADP-heptose:LPS heptosyltransferase
MASDSMQAFAPCPPVGISLPKKIVAAGLGCLSALCRLARSRPPQSGLPPKVVLLEPFGMGDALSLLPLVQALDHHGVAVVVCARPAWRAFFPPHIEWVDCTVPWASYGDDEKYRLRAFIGPVFRGFLRSLRHAASGHIGIDTRGDSRSTLLLWLAGCRRVYSLDRYLGSNLRNVQAAAHLLPLDPHLRRWQVNARFAAPLGCPPDGIGRPRLPRPPRASPAPPSLGVAIVPITPWPGRAWPATSWQEVIARLQADGQPVVAMGGPGQHTALRDAVGPAPTLVICQSIGDWIENLSKCEAVIALDSGPAHLADALSVPLVALYGSGQLPLWAPSAPFSRVLHRQNDPDYQPIHPVDANIPRGLELMSRHTADDVLATLAAVRKEAAGSPSPTSP